MKTSILISSIAALCLMISLAEAPNHNADKKISTNSISRNSFIPTHLTAKLPHSEKFIAEGKKSENYKPSESVNDDFSYLKFRISDSQDELSASMAELPDLPESSESEPNYLQFDVLKYMSETSASIQDYAELPDKQTITNPDNTSAKVEEEFGYLKFNVTNLASENQTDTSGIGILPDETENENSNLRFDVRKYYNTEEFNAGIPADLPAIE